MSPPERSSSRTVRPVSDDDEPRIGHARDRRDRRAESLRLVSRPTKTNVPGVELLRLDLARRRRRVRQHVDPLVRRAPSRARSRPGTRSGRRSCARAGALALRSALRRRTGARRRRLELLERAGEEAVALRALVGGVGDELRDERAAREHATRAPRRRTSPRRRRRRLGGRPGRRVAPPGRSGRERAACARPPRPRTAAPRARRRPSSRRGPNGRGRRETGRSPARASQARRRQAARYR